VRKSPLLVSLALTLLAPLAVEAQEAVPRPAVVLLTMTFTGKTENPALRALIEDSVSVELQSRGITTIVSDDPVPDQAALDELARAEKADFAIVGIYDLTGETVKLEFSWYDVELRQESKAASIEGEIDLSFDRLISDLIGGIIDARSDRLASLPPPQEQGGGAASEAGASPAAGTSAADAAVPLPVEAPAPAEIHAIPLPEQGATPAGPAPRITHLSFSAGAAPFVPLSKASAYIPNPGLTLSAEAEYRLALGSGLLGVSLRSGVHMFHAQKQSAADATVVPVQLALSYLSRSGSILDFRATVGAGPAVFALTPAGGNTLVGVVPYVSAGIGLGLTFFEHIGLSLSLGWVSVFVKEAIMGFDPSVALEVKL
jgi:hypothetical protein